MQCLLGDAARISQPSLSRIITELTDALVVTLAPQFITMPRDNEVRGLEGIISTSNDGKLLLIMKIGFVVASVH